VNVQQYLEKLEQNLMTGTARWAADFTESFRNRQVGNVQFDMVVHGNTRAKGFLISRFISFILTPNYYVACFVHPFGAEEPNFHNLVRNVKKYMDEHNMTWTWLVLVKEGEASRGLRQLVASWTEQAIGVALVDLSIPKVVANSNSHMGRTALQHTRCFK